MRINWDIDHYDLCFSIVNITVLPQACPAVIFVPTDDLELTTRSQKGGPVSLVVVAAQCSVCESFLSFSRPDAFVRHGFCNLVLQIAGTVAARDSDACGLCFACHEAVCERCCLESFQITTSVVLATDYIKGASRVCTVCEGRPLISPRAGGFAIRVLSRQVLQ
jgi:hypothetical protein